jgi:hypothetical protein
MVDYQFLGMVAVILAVVSRGSAVPVVAVTVVVGLLTLACETGATRYRRRRPRPAAGSTIGAPAQPDGELNRWMTAVERVLRAPD